MREVLLYLIFLHNIMLKVLIILTPIYIHKWSMPI